MVTRKNTNIYEVTYQPVLEIAETYNVHAYHLKRFGLKGEYFDNAHFTTTGAIETRIDPEIDFHWGTSLIMTDFSDFVAIRWSGKIKPPLSRSWTFYVKADDGARLWIDKLLILDT